MTPTERVVACALIWQETVDLLVALAPADDPELVRQATKAHMDLLHAARDYRRTTVV